MHSLPILTRTHAHRAAPGDVFLDSLGKLRSSFSAGGVLSSFRRAPLPKPVLESAYVSASNPGQNFGLLRAFRWPSLGRAPAVAETARLESARLVDPTEVHKSVRTAFDKFGVALPDLPELPNPSTFLVSGRGNLVLDAVPCAE